ncbi:unnamed protein product [Peronospora belbahrii]|uniref:Tyrosinase copper-binding domain-containing protein n=1 Tax=Peronospora belbahrii TaxID=622444 RepID=A0AAU9KU22_9STRA|nr:unnamed protein product [Peronospora belbahrii]CAH0518589.1 unnamed protein product [Peronospora belbahrii]
MKSKMKRFRKSSVDEQIQFAMARNSCRMGMTTLLIVYLCLLVSIWKQVDAKYNRVRKSWSVYTPDEKVLYLRAVKKSMTLGYHLLFTQIYMDPNSLQYVVGTCGAPAWYRKFLLGYETMLRSLDTTFKDLTVPYWDIFDDSAKRISTYTPCNGIEGCSPILQDFGGCQGRELIPGTYVVNGEVIPSGNCANASIAAYACTNRNMCEKCLPRGDWGIGDSSLEFGPTTFVELIRHAARHVKSSSRPNLVAMDTLRKEIQSSVQLTLHSLLGGVYETRAAAFDPIFFSHYATLDMMYQFVQSCNQSIALTGFCQGNDGFQVSSTATIPMTIKNIPVERHADLGVFFEAMGTSFKSMDTYAVEYEIDLFLQNMLKQYSLQCDADTSAPGAISYATVKETFKDAAAIHTFVNNLAACEKTSTVKGTTTTETSAAFISCQLLSSLQNGVFTNFSTPVREFFGVGQDDLPKCVKALAAVTSAEVTLIPSKSCQKAIHQDTSLNMATDFNSIVDGFAIVTRGAQDGAVRYMEPIQ